MKRAERTEKQKYPSELILPQQCLRRFCRCRCENVSCVWHETLTVAVTSLFPFILTVLTFNCFPLPANVLLKLLAARCLAGPAGAGGVAADCRFGAAWRKEAQHTFSCFCLQNSPVGQSREVFAALLDVKDYFFFLTVRVSGRVQRYPAAACPRVATKR